MRRAEDLLRHKVTGRPLRPPFPEGLRRAAFAMGCFWRPERLFWEHGVYNTAVGYCGGQVPDPGYREVCGGRTGHAETVLVMFDPVRHSYAELLRLFWEGHDPTQGMRQGPDVGPQYRSAIFTADEEQRRQALESLEECRRALRRAGRGDVTTEIAPLTDFYYAEEYHQQYLARGA